MTSTETKKSPVKFIAAGIAAVVIIVAILVPVIPVTAKEQYTETETKTETYQEMQTQTQQYTKMETQQQPYQQLETQKGTLFSGNDVTLKGDQYVHYSATINAGRSVEFSVSATDTVDTFVLTSSEYSNFVNGQSYQKVAERDGVSNTRYGFTASIDDTYYFVVSNPHNGLFGIGAKNVGVYSASGTQTWQEMVTHYHDIQVPVTKTREVQVPITKTRDVQVPVTKTRDVTKNHSIIELLMQK